MNLCARHPDREAAFQCMKHEIFMCEECVRCKDPELYCKHRPSCPVWLIYKERRRKQRRFAEATDNRIRPEAGM